LVYGLFFLKDIVMKLVTLIALSATLVAAPAFASKDLATKSGCLACHAADKKLVGPSYQDVAKKYAGKKDAEVTLAASIKAGGSGKWGQIPMPAQNLSDADLKTLAKWILAGAK
jgi:cytochrome c